MKICKFVLTANTLDELVALQTLTPQAARFLEAAVVAGLNTIVAGAPGPKTNSIVGSGGATALFAESKC
jgi:Flp pilus assembly CpaF family ATPase